MNYISEKRPKNFCISYPLEHDIEFRLYKKRWDHICSGHFYDETKTEKKTLFSRTFSLEYMDEILQKLADALSLHQRKWIQVEAKKIKYKKRVQVWQEYVPVLFFLEQTKDNIYELMTAFPKPKISYARNFLKTKNRPQHPASMKKRKPPVPSR
jgi:hypothetical protein